MASRDGGTHDGGDGGRGRLEEEMSELGDALARLVARERELRDRRDGATDAWLALELGREITYSTAQRRQLESRLSAVEQALAAPHSAPPVAEAGSADPGPRRDAVSPPTPAHRHPWPAPETGDLGAPASANDGDAGMAAKAISRATDLRLIVRHFGAPLGSLHFELDSPRPELSLNLRSFGERILKRPIAEYFHQALEDVARRRMALEDPAEMAAQLEDLGALLAAELLPPDLAKFLAGFLDAGCALHIDSDESFIPWELLRLTPRETGQPRPSLFLCEAFVLTRWRIGLSYVDRVNLDPLAIVEPKASSALAREEITALITLAAPRRIEMVPARSAAVRSALASARYGGWHFAGHGMVGVDADRAAILLDEDEKLTPVALVAEARPFGQRQPMLFLNSCTSGRGGFSLTAMGGWAERAIGAGASAFIGSYWPVTGEAAKAFATTVYSLLFGGSRLGQAVWQARQRIRSVRDCSWLAYTVYCHPTLTCATADGAASGDPAPAGVVASDPAKP